MSATLVHSAPVAREHHERLLRHVDQMPAIAELMERGATDELRFALGEMCDFMTELLVPHMEAAERAIYPELERVLQNRHSMTPMRREHTEIRSGVAELVRLRGIVDRPPLSVKDQVALRRIVFRLYGLLKVHLAEELLYAEIVEHGASPEAEQALAAAMEHSGTGSFE
ncbi:MAG TPA: hemerythrin domain-containing protein [Candidatus Limnocylindrales bacterium]|nr:hemerythrin domain-containing protein [Candidatus Limnocylindrales bacterium]